MSNKDDLHTSEITYHIIFITFYDPTYIKTYPEASGGKRTTTFPISAPGRSINFPS